MPNINNLHVFHDARALLRGIHQLTQRGVFAGFGDLRTQIERASISVVSNIAEGAALGSDKQFRKHLIIARGSAQEVYAQLLICHDTGRMKGSDLIEIANRLIARLIVFIYRLKPD